MKVKDPPFSKAIFSLIMKQQVFSKQNKGQKIITIYPIEQEEGI